MWTSLSGQSPDLNPMELLWRDLKMAVHWRFPSKLMELLRFCKEETLSSVILKKTVTAAKGASTKYWAKAVNTHVHVTIHFIFFHSYFGVSFVPGLMQIQAEHSNFIQKVSIRLVSSNPGRLWRTMFTCSMFSPCLRGFFPGYSERFKMTKMCEWLTVIFVTDWQQMWQALGPRDLMCHSTYLLFVICLLFLM